MKSKIKYSILIIILSTLSLKLFSQVTPPMGWNSWNEFRFNVSERLIMEIADAMKMHKLDEAGYKYIVLDDGWQSDTPGEHGKLQASKSKFPNGIEPLVKYLNTSGFELGIYSSPNVLTCGGFQGSLGMEKLHVQQFSDWGVKFLKYDYCPTRNKEQGNSAEIILERIRAMHDALSEIDSTIIYAICEKGWIGGQHKNAQKYRKQIEVTPENRKDLFEWAPELGTMWRTTEDIRPDWDRIMYILDKQEGLASLSGPGSFNDPDMLEVGNGNLTLAENRAHFSLWCILAAPLFLGNDIRNMDAEILEVITNKELIALNQDKLCKQAEKIYDENGIEVFLKPLQKGDLGVCILNRSEIGQRFKLKWKYLGINPKETFSVRDLWAHKNLKGTKKALITKINPHDVMVFRFSRN